MELRKIIEALLLASHEPVTTRELVRIVKGALDEVSDEAREALGKITENTVEEALQAVDDHYRECDSAATVAEGAAGWKLYTRPEMAEWVRHLFPDRKPERLSAPALETLAIIAYRQPITKADIEAVRGVNVDGVLQKIIDRGLVHIGGRADLPGRPLLYETSEIFLDHFGIKNLDDLPNAGELRRVELPKAEDAGDAGAEEKQLTFGAGGKGAAEGDEEEGTKEAGESEEASGETEAETEAETEDEAEDQPEAEIEDEPEAEAVAESVEEK